MADNNLSVVEKIMALPLSERAEALAEIRDNETALAFFHDWRLWARPSQIPPPLSEPWRFFLLLAGRGFGKTRSAVEFLRWLAETGEATSMGILGQTADVVRRVCVEGPSGVLAVCPSWNRPIFEPTNRRIVWSNGAVAYLFSSEEPDRLRGSNISFLLWDELCHSTNVEVCMANALLALRVTGPKGMSPRMMITSTPRPIPILKSLMSDPTCVVRHGSTSENAANLDASALKDLYARYDGSRLGEAELHGRVLWDTPDALWTWGMIEKARLVGDAPDMVRIVVGVDPSGGGRGGDETGIIVAGKGTDGICYILGDYSLHALPNVWGSRVVSAFHDFEADRIVVEHNYGGAVVTALLRTLEPNIPLKSVSASHGKSVRAEPVAALFDQGRVRLCGKFPKLEDQLTSFVGGVGDDRLDAMVWAVTDLMLKREARVRDWKPPMRINLYAR